MRTVRSLKRYAKWTMAALVSEPLHPSWSAADVPRRGQQAHISVVAADPSLIMPDLKPFGDPALCCSRLHGNARTYWSPYDEAACAQWP